MNASDYVQLELREQIYLNVDTYCSSAEPYERIELVYNFQSNKIVPKVITLPEAVEHLEQELNLNACDNVTRSREFKENPGSITMTMNRTHLKVRNEGTPIPVERNSQGIYVPHMIFGTLLTSSNYRKTGKRVGGKNGYGAKLCNLFSHEFEIDIGDHIRKFRYQQKWANNMITFSPPIITPYEGTTSFVEVQYKLDFPRFKLNHYEDEAFELFARHAAESSLTCKVPVKFIATQYMATSEFPGHNIELNFDFTDPKKFINLLIEDPPQETTSFMLPSDLAKLKPKVAHFEIEDLEVLAIETLDNGKIISFINSIPTKMGVHVDKVMKKFSEIVLAKLKEVLTKGRKNAPPLRLSVDVRDISKHLTVIIIFKGDDPQFDSQTKTNLRKPEPKNILIPDPFAKEICKWDFVERLARLNNLKAADKLPKNRGASSLPKLDDAMMAETNQRLSAILFLTEGDSAKTYAIKMRKYLGEFGKYIGVYPLRGKLRNVTHATELDLLGNQEIQDVIQAVGLQRNVDYTLYENRITLRYGRIVALSDSDVDGKHIRGLIFNFIFRLFPTVLYPIQGMSDGPLFSIGFMRTQEVTATKGNTVIPFLTTSQLNEWIKQFGTQEEAKNQGWHFKHFKGLGTSEEHDIERTCQNLCIVNTYIDQDAQKAFNLMFHKDFSDQRKQYFEIWAPRPDLEAPLVQPISHYIYYELPEYSLANIKRSIPSLIDGQKPSQRKVIHGMMKGWFKERADSKTKIGKKVKNESKVIAFAGDITKKTLYEHGESSLYGTIIGMAQDFVGSNNLPILMPKGNFGTRLEGGKDHSAPRYLNTQPQWWIRYVFRKEDDAILKLCVEQGKKIEPEFYLPTICLTLINGVSGIGSGFSTWGPSYHPLAITDWLKCRLMNSVGSTTPLPKLHPWYRGFKGTIELVDNKDNSTVQAVNGETQNIEIINDESNPEKSVDVDEVGSGKLRMVTTGIYEEKGNRVYIKELPIGRWSNPYLTWLKKISETKEEGKRNYMIGKVNSSQDDKNVNFELIDVKFNVNENSLRLVKSYSLNNMVLLDMRDKPKRYANVESILEEFFTIRLSYYGVRKQHILNDLQKQIAHSELKLKFMIAVHTGEITVNRHDSLIYADMDVRGFPRDFYNKAKLRSISDNNIEKLRQKILELYQKYQELNAKRNEDLWFSDINEFEVAYKKNYNE